MSQQGANVRVERMPFTVYDIIGYLAPGLLTLVFILALPPPLEAFSFLPSYTELRDGIGAYGATEKIIFAVILLIFSYLIGHLISFLSSITIERFLVIWEGYPSAWAFRNYLKANWFELAYTSQKKITEDSGQAENNSLLSSIREAQSFTSFTLLHVFLLPLTVGFIASAVIGARRSVIKPLPDSIIIDALFHTDQIGAPIKSKTIGTANVGDWFKWANAYVINTNNIAFLRMYNYLTLYGFMRSTVFVFNLVSWNVIITHLNTTPSPEAVVQDGLVISCVAITTISFLSYIKFYRRYTEEAIYALHNCRN